MMIPFILMFSDNYEIKSGIFTATKINKMYTGFFEDGEVSLFLKPVMFGPMNVDEYYKYYDGIVENCHNIHGNSDEYRLSQIKKDTHIMLIKDDKPVMVKDLNLAESKHSDDIVKCTLGMRLLVSNKNTLISKLSVSESYINVLLLNSETEDINIVLSDMDQIELMKLSHNPFVDFTIFSENEFC